MYTFLFLFQFQLLFLFLYIGVWLLLHWAGIRIAEVSRKAAGRTAESAAWAATSIDGGPGLLVAAPAHALGPPCATRNDILGLWLSLTGSQMKKLIRTMSWLWRWRPCKLQAWKMLQRALPVAWSSLHPWSRQILHEAAAQGLLWGSFLFADCASSSDSQPKDKLSWSTDNLVIIDLI